MLNRIFILSLCFTWYAGQSKAQQPHPYPSRGKNVFNAFVNNKVLQNASIGFCIMNAGDGKTLFKYNDSLALAPASCLKIVTTGAALSLLGTNYRFSTRIGYDGWISGGVLHGDIIVMGGGDPTLGSDRWNDESKMPVLAALISKKMRVAGIQTITGKLIIDITHFDNGYCCRSWACDDTGNYFGAGSFGFNINENRYDLKLQAGNKTGDNVKIISYSPELLHLQFDNRLVTGLPYSGDQSNIFPGVNDSSICLNGSIQPSSNPFTIKGAMPNPPEFASKYLAEKLYGSGLLNKKTDWQVNNGCTGITYQSLKIIDSLESPELIDIVHYTNLNSVNIYAECILKETGKVINGEGNRKSGIVAVKNYWFSNGIDTTGLYMEDGCGLAKNDRISAYQLCRMLSVISKQQYFYQFLNSLPVAGQSGAMKSMGKGTAIEGKLYCKTGHISGIRAYCGYVKSKSGKWVCFSLIVNNYACSSQEIHDAIEQLLISLATVND